VRIWVSGARGFVGSRLVPQLESRGHTVLTSDRETDVQDAGAVDAAVAGARPDAVVHLAAVASVAHAHAAPASAARVNTLGTLHVLRAVARKAPAARVLVIGSGEVYGQGPGSPFDETAPLRPLSAYARSKAAADRLGAVFAARGLDVVRVRPFSHTGPGQADHYVASSFARQIAEIESGRRTPVLAVGNLDAVRDVLDVDDVVDAYVALLEGRVPPAAYNVATGVGIRVGELLDRLLAASSIRPEVRTDPALWRPAGASVGDARRLRNATGWRPTRPLDDTLMRLLADWRLRIHACR
jgi:GDP-4-dehydro-6-deoxy-D-mannose reductase